MIRSVFFFDIKKISVDDSQNDKKKRCVLQRFFFNMW